MQQIIKKPDHILKYFIPENRGCLLGKGYYALYAKISIQKAGWNFFSKINVQKIHRKHLRE